MAASLPPLFASSWNRDPLLHSEPKTWSAKTAYQITDPASGCLWCVKAGVVGRIVITDTSQGLEKVSFAPFKPEEFVTAFDKYFVPLRKAGAFLQPSSITPQQAKILLASDALRRSLPHIERIFMFSMPIFIGEKNTHEKGGLLRELAMCPAGFGEYRDQVTAEPSKFYCHTPPDKSMIEGINKMDMPLDEAKELIERIYSEFRFLDSRSKTNAIAHLITPYCQGLIGARKKSPLWMFTADGPRSGKDYAAMISLIVHEGIAVQDPPLEDESEFKRRITSAILSGRRFQHLANCRGALDSPSLEAAVTTEFWADRLIGSSEAPVLVNALIFSLSFNGDPYLSADIIARARRVHLSKKGGPANKVAFEQANLHACLASWDPLPKGRLEKKTSESGTGSASGATTPKVDICRRNVLKALQSLVRNWVDTGASDGNVFTSFPDWARVVGGVMQAAGLGDPTELSALDCKSDKLSDQQARAFGWLAVREGSAKMRSAGEIKKLLARYDDQFEDKDHRFNLVWSKTSESFGKMLSSAALKGHWRQFSVVCDGNDSRPKYAISFLENDFLSRYSDFVEIFNIPKENPSEFEEKSE